MCFSFVTFLHSYPSHPNVRQEWSYCKRLTSKFRPPPPHSLYFQCQSESPRFICNGLAEVYYAAVRAFGGDDATPGKRDEDLVAIYEEKLALYNDMVEEAKAFGILPELE